MWICPAALCTLTLAVCQPPERVGVFHRPSIVVAFDRSDLWLRQVRQRKEAMDAAKKAGGRRKAAALDRWGRDAQRLARRQLAGKAPMDNIWEALQPLLPEVAARAGVSRAVLDPPPGAETADVTPHLLDALHAGPSTRQIAGGLRQRDERRGSARR
jgi:hypothetical protein